MSANPIVYILFQHPVDDSMWQQDLLPFACVWDEKQMVYHGSLLYHEQLVASARFYPLENRLELIEAEHAGSLLADFLALEKVQKLCANPITEYARTQLETMQRLQPALQDPENLHDWRVALRKFRTVFPSIVNELGGKERAAYRAILKRAGRYSGRMRDMHSIAEGLASYGIQWQGKPVDASRLQVLMDESVYNALHALLKTTIYDVCTYRCQDLLDVQRKRLRKAIHHVHTDQDTASLHAVRKAVKAMRYLRELAGLEADAVLDALQKTLGTWHDLVLCRDVLLTYKKPSIDILQVLVHLELDIAKQVELYKGLSRPLWEDGT